jgi:FG-GAP repeat
MTGAAANPLVAQETKLTASNGAAGHNFGKSVATEIVRLLKKAGRKATG